MVTVELQAPLEPGNYQCHWRLNHHGQRFGHRVWCAITVDPAYKEEEVVVEEEEADADTGEALTKYVEKELSQASEPTVEEEKIEDGQMDDAQEEARSEELEKHTTAAVNAASQVCINLGELL